MEIIASTYVLTSLMLAYFARVRGPHGMNEFKDRAVALVSLLVAPGLLAAGFLNFDNPLAMILAGLTAFAACSIGWSENAITAFSEVLRMAALTVFFCLAVAIPEGVLRPFLILPAAVMAALGTAGAIAGREWWNRLMDDRFKAAKPKYRHEFAQFLGNNNYMGATLPALVFLSLQGAQTQPAWYAATAALLAGVIATRARGAYLATAAGGLFLLFSMADSLDRVMAAAIAALAAGWLAWSVWRGNRDSILNRLCYARIVRELLRHRIFMGWGPNSFRLRIFRAQAEINERDPSWLGTPPKPGRHTHPYGEHAHNDHIEMLTSFGVPGALLWAALIIIAPALAMVHGRPMGASAAVAWIVGAGAFYSWHYTPAALVGMGTFALCSQGVSAGALGAFPVYYGLGMGFAVLAVWRPLRAILAHHHLTRAMEIGNTAPKDGSREERERVEAHDDRRRREVERALELDPEHCGKILDAVMCEQMFRNPGQALAAASLLVAHFDGQWTEGYVQSAWARACAHNRAYIPAMQAFRTAIWLEPRNPTNYKQLAATKDQMERFLVVADKVAARNKRKLETAKRQKKRRTG